jgi:hypothetical protein
LLLLRFCRALLLSLCAGAFTLRLLMCWFRSSFDLRNLLLATTASDLPFALLLFYASRITLFGTL